MKSLLVSRRYFPPRMGGIPYMMRGIARVLGPDEVCCLTAVPAADLHEEPGLRVYRRPAAFLGGRARQGLRLGVTLAEIMVRERFRVLQLATAAEGYVGLRLDSWLGIPFVVYAHGNEILESLRSDWDRPRRALRAADRVLANSRFTAELVRKAGADPGRIEIVYPGCDAEHFTPQQPPGALAESILGSRRGSPILLTVGRLEARKGHDLVIQALPRVLEKVPDATYLIVGDGPERPRLEQLARAAGIGDRVIFTGRRGDSELPGLIALADVFVMPSRADLVNCDVEGFGLVFLEAGACGKPVVGGRSGGVPEAVVDGVTGFLADPGDPEDLARVLTRLLGDRNLARRLGDEGRRRVVRDFTWARMGRQVAQILETVVRARCRTNPGGRR